MRTSSSATKNMAHHCVQPCMIHCALQEQQLNPKWGGEPWQEGEKTAQVQVQDSLGNQGGKKGIRMVDDRPLRVTVMHVFLVHYRYKGMQTCNDRPGARHCSGWHVCFFFP